MEYDHELSGGCITLEKRAFTLEMIDTESFLKNIITRAPETTIVKKEKFVEIDFNKIKNITLDDDFKNKLSLLKNKYNENIYGKLSIRVLSTIPYTLIANLNRKKVQFI